MSFSATTYSGQANRGVDRKITIKRNDNNEQIQLGGRLASIEISDKDTIEEVDGIDNEGKVDHNYYPGGAMATVTVNRYNGDFEGFAKFMNANFYAGGNDIKGTVIVETTNGFDGSTDLDTLTLCTFSKFKSGPFTNKKNPQVTFQIDAQERI